MEAVGSFRDREAEVQVATVADNGHVITCAGSEEGVG